MTKKEKETIISIKQKLKQMCHEMNEIFKQSRQINVKWWKEELENIINKL